MIAATDAPSPFRIPITSVKYSSPWALELLSFPIEAAKAAKVEIGDTMAIKCWLEYRYGKPKQLIGLVTENESLEQVFKIGGVEIKL